MKDDNLENENTEDTSDFDGLPRKFIPSRFSIMTPEQRKEAGHKGGTRSAEVRRERKAMKETLLLLLGMPIKRGKVVALEDVKAFADLKGKNVDMQTAGLIQQVQKFAKGDKEAAVFIRDTIGERPLNVPAEDDSLNDQIAAASEIIFQVRRAPTSEEGVDNANPTDTDTAENN